jgi:hypothetical protein
MGYAPCRKIRSASSYVSGGASYILANFAVIPGRQRFQASNLFTETCGAFTAHGGLTTIFALSA